MVRLILSKIPDILVPIHNTEHSVGGYGGYNMRWGKNERYTQYRNRVFEDTLRILEFGKTSSGSPYINLESLMTGYKYPMRWMQMKDFFLNGVVNKGVLSDVFTFDLKWNYYTLALVDRKAMPIILTQHDLRGPFWWDDQSIIVLKH